MTTSAPTRLPPWIRKSLITDKGYNRVDGLVDGFHLNTVCEAAKCPNRHECWNRGSATIMILGDICTRACKFCAIKTGRPLEVDIDEPRRVALAARQMKLKHIVVTSVDRDDLEDFGAGIWAETIRALREALPEASIEVLTPDFNGDERCLATVLEAAPDVFNHNIETVQRLQPTIRPMANYGRSMAVLRFAAQWNPGLAVKSGIMLGLGEEQEEVEQSIQDLYGMGVRLLTLGQYLRPTREHIRVDRYAPPAEFEALDQRAREIGFPAVASGPMVRSSYRADELLAQFRAA